MVYGLYIRNNKRVDGIASYPANHSTYPFILGCVFFGMASMLFFIPKKYFFQTLKGLLSKIPHISQRMPFVLGR